MTEPICRVLVVEDEMLLAMLIEDMLTDLGFEVVGPAMRLETALSLANEEAIDCAILDVNLNGKQSFPVADILRERGIPFFFATGYGKQGLNETHKDTFTLKKPFAARELRQALTGCLAGVGSFANVTRSTEEPD